MQSFVVGILQDLQHILKIGQFHALVDKPVFLRGEFVGLMNIFFCRELSSTFARLCRVVDAATTDMNEELKQIESGLTVLESNQKQIKMLKNKANYITNELEIFENNYIKSN